MYFWGQLVYTLLIDMDSVLVDLMTEWHYRYNIDYNDSLHVSKIDSWHMERYVKPECGLKIYDYLHQPGLFAKLKPLPGAIETFTRLYEKYPMFIVTTSPHTAFQDKLLWLETNLPWFPTTRVIFTHHKEQIRGDLLFDDSPVNLSQFQATGRVAVAMDYPYNRSLICPRVTNWLEFEEQLPLFLKGVSS